MLDNLIKSNLTGFMKNFFISLLIFGIWSFFGLWLYSSFQTSKDELNLSAQSLEAKDGEMGPNSIDSTNIIKNESVVGRESLMSSSGFDRSIEGLRAMNEDGDLIFVFDEGIAIKKNSPSIVIPASAIDFKYKINSYLIEHPNEELVINAYYDASESLETPNLGDQRGMEVQKILINLGILRERIVVKSTIQSLDFDSTGTFNNGISLQFKPLDEDRFKNPTVTIPQSQTIYPKFVNNDVFANQEMRDLLTEAKFILDTNPEVVLEVIGHTDYVGNAQDNYLVALKYAQQVRWYLISKGDLDKSRIKASSKGETEPIANNASAQGRLLNRRIEIKYIQN